MFDCRLVAKFSLFALLSTSLPALAGRAEARDDQKTSGVSAESFLRRPASSVAQVIDQIQNDAVIRERFARYLHLSSARVVPFLKANLISGTIPADSYYTVQCVRPGGSIYPTKQAFRRGDKVFALRDGQPILQYRCGNPLARFVTPIETIAEPKKPETVIVVPTHDREIPLPVRVNAASSQARN